MDLEEARPEAAAKPADAAPKLRIPGRARHLPLVTLAAFGLLALLALDVHFDGLVATLVDRPVGGWVVDHVDARTRHFLDGTVTWISDDPVVYPLVAVAAFALALRGPWRTALWMVGTAGLGGLLVVALKHTVDRARPVEVAFGAAAVDGMSPAFPSGHTLNAFVGWGLILGVFLYESALRRGTLEPTLLRMNLGVWVLIVAVTAVGRVLAGVHWPGDILGSVLLGTGLLAASIHMHLRFVWPREVGT